MATTARLRRCFQASDAPDFLVDGVAQHGGEVDGRFSMLEFGAVSGTIYYTTDGTDPRSSGGGVSSNAIAYNAGLTEANVFEFGSIWNYQDQGANLGTSWRNVGYNDNGPGWSSAATQLGYGEDGEANVISFGNDSNNKHITTYFRKTFTVGDEGVVSATLNLKRDDGAVVYLNGTEIGRSNLPNGTIGYTTLASSAIGGAAESTPVAISFDPGLLLAGNNTLAVEIHQVNGGSSDLAFDAELVVATQSSASPPYVFGASTNVQARTLSGGDWSALNDANFIVPAMLDDLRITEIHYHPDADGEEFVEFTNISSTLTLNLEGVSLTDGPLNDFTFGAGVTLAPGESIVITSDGGAFTTKYPEVPLGGQFTGGLSNGGERLTLVDPNGEVLLSFVYDDKGDWPAAADGEGASLTLIDPATDVSQLGDGNQWRASFTPNGTPGTLIDNPQTLASVEGRFAFYNNSRFDGNSAAANAGDDGAIASGKQALLPGQTATFANYTSYSRGLNGLFIDVANLANPQGITAADLSLAVGTNANNFSALATAAQVSVRTGAGVNGSDRITLTLPDGAVQKQWLRVTLAANANTGLAQNDVFYFGNIVGETGNSAANATVNISDIGAVRGSQSGFGTVPIGNAYDHNRDGRVNLADLAITRENQSGFTPVSLITTPVGSSSLTSQQVSIDVETREARQLQAAAAYVQWQQLLAEVDDGDEPPAPAPEL